MVNENNDIGRDLIVLETNISNEIIQQQDFIGHKCKASCKLAETKDDYFIVSACERLNP